MSDPANATCSSGTAPRKGRRSLRTAATPDTLVAVPEDVDNAALDAILALLHERSARREATQDEEDLEHDLVVRLLSHRASLIPATLRALANVIAHRLRIDRYRRRRRTRTTPLVEEPCGREPDPAETIASTDEQERLRRAVSRLPPDLRESLRLKYFEDRTYTQIAEECGISFAAAVSRVGRALQLLRRRLAE